MTLQHDTAAQREVRAQDAALIWLLATTMRPHWRPLAISLVLLLGTAALNVVPPYLMQVAIDGPIAAGDASGVLPLALLYGAAALALGLGFVACAWRVLHDDQDDQGVSRTGDAPAKAAFKFSIAYLFILFAALAADRLVG